MSLGVGFGLFNLSSVVILATYFKKKLAFACGIVACGTDLGALIMAPVINFLVHQFGWSYAFMILGAFLFGCVPIGLLFKPISDNYEPARTMSTCSDLVNIDEENNCTRFCSIFKFPNILYDPVFTFVLLANFLANIGFPIAYSYAVVSMSRCSSFSHIYTS